MKLYEVSKDVFDEFASRNKIRNFYQTSEYGDWMEKRGYKCMYLAFMDDVRTIHAATLIIYKNVFADYKYGYAPRGFLINYTDESIFREFTRHLKLFLKARNFAYLKIDPPIIYKSRDKKGNYNISGKNNTPLIERMKSLGYIHLGFNNNFEALKPRWNAVIKLDKNENEMFKSFSKDIRNKINNSKRKGLIVYKGSKEDIPVFYEFIKKNYDRPISYYYDYYEIFKRRDMIDLYLVKLDPITYLETSKYLYENELDNNSQIVEKMRFNYNNKSLLNKKIESDKLLNTYKKDVALATKLLSEHPEGLIIGGSMVIKYNKQLQFLIDGIDENYKSFNPNHLLKWTVIREYLNSNYYYIDLNGIVGNFSSENNPYYGLNKFKLGFNSDVIEYVGEFNLPINQPLYHLIQKSSSLGFGVNIGTNRK
ncbi:MAG: peptidoglycan bridge formation glycyltransferase FemA/FemB family protein [Bacilli bacterium]|nr:peptidoglycan bridge formation glycyltransferase FemA/FemB family protein [Bacilli bacterium]